MATIQEVLDQVAALPVAPKPYINPYAGHRALSEHEQELLGEYARLADTVRRVAALSTLLSSSSAHASLLTQLRVLERKMGLVLTLYKASVWATVQEQAEMAEAEAMAAAGAEMNGYSLDVNGAAAMYGSDGAGGAYYYGSGAPSESGEGDDTVVMRQAEYY
ncbi:DASH complex subunit Dad3 [Kalmanozyma brasiliensis GHG001]|uniref:DASH complex subunit DAD3 n=1 Tax=Kalmanozyma brasiliensis (strain GHG001) TaxID=1365824 RepID=V5EVU9_KALBG|nr:DASH complex subunit Dad3 [Kalmanozyma brasiliensis GHG001]EST09615.1 DASH complex subunit Dad3 [Kalmanozyma brasiliensis GHG001]